ncbi:hypothetical protein GJ496_010658 [Pomphorhynchus laevis]|nr:hypothetical protein GJ496_010658 [Pomphorhynchus laevis]
MNCFVTILAICLTYVTCLSANIRTVVSNLYRKKTVENGMILSKHETKNGPNITLHLNCTHYYTLIMVDPDAPSAKEPSISPLLHFYNYNIVNSDINGKFLAKYHSPAPPNGIRDYVIILYRQKGGD